MNKLLTMAFAAALITACAAPVSNERDDTNRIVSDKVVVSHTIPI